MISIENLKHFLAVVDNQGVLRAADKLFISGSSLSRSIHQIESDLGKPLFDRVGRMLSLNQEGRRLYEKTRVLLHHYALLLHEEGSISELLGHYRIGASHFLCEYLLCDLVTQLIHKCKNATFEVYSLDSNVLIKKIHDGEIDLGFSFSPKISDMIEHKKIIEGQLYLCASKKHPLIKKQFSEIKKYLADYPAVIHRPNNSIERCDTHPMFKKFNLNPKIQVYWDSDAFAVGLLARSNHWSMLPDFVIESNNKIDSFQHPTEWNAHYEVDLIWNKRKALTELKDIIFNLISNKKPGKIPLANWLPNS